MADIRSDPGFEVIFVLEKITVMLRCLALTVGNQAYRSMGCIKKNGSAMSRLMALAIDVS